MRNQALHNIKDNQILCDIRSLLDSIEPPSYLVDDLVEEGTTGAIIGASGSGKSFLGIAISCHVAAGSDFCGLQTKQGQVVYMAGEGRRGIVRRVKAWEQKHGTTIPDQQFIISSKTVTLDAHGAEILMEAVSGMNLRNVKLLVIDTLARHMVGEENSNTVMSEFMSAVDYIRDNLGCTVIIIHHTGHDSTSKGRARGASAFYAALDFEFLVSKKYREHFIEGTKNKEGKNWEQHVFHLETIAIDGLFDNYGKSVESAVIEWINATDKETTSDNQLSKPESTALNVFNAALQKYGTDSIVNGITTRSIDLGNWRRHSIEINPSDKDESKNAMFRKQKKLLIDAGLVEEKDGMFSHVNQSDSAISNNVTMFRKPA